MVTRNPLEMPKTGRWLALDVGTKRVGVAVSDSAGRVGSAVGAVARVMDIDFGDWKTRGVAGVVVGWPLNMDGSAGPSADRARSVADWVEKNTGLPVLLWDERLTSVQAEAAWGEQRVGRQSRGGKHASVGKVDAAAAVLILQGALDAAR